MKAIKLTIKNIGIVEDAVIDLNKPLLCFYGEIRQGKTTLLNSVKWVFGGSFPTDIIRRGETEGLIQLDLDEGALRRTFYRAKDGTTKARALVFEKNGVPIRDAVAEVKKFLNPFLLDQNHLASMSELERKKYFASMFAVDTAGLDKDIIATEAKAVEARSRLKAYGDIDLTPVEQPADLASLAATRTKIINLHQEQQQTLHGELANRRNTYQAQLTAVNDYNRKTRENNAQVDLGEAEAGNILARIKQYETGLEIARQDLARKQEWLKNNQKGVEQPMPVPPATSDIEQKLSAPVDTAEVDSLLRKGEADKVRFEQYVKNKARQNERESDEALILSLEATIRELRSKKLAKLQQCGESSGIAGLKFDEAGNFNYQGCEAGMLSTSQLMKLSSELSALYPPGFGVELLDRGESLGKSIFDFIEHAKENNKTILAAIVGEKPAMVPADVGVFVVECGEAKEVKLT